MYCKKIYFLLLLFCLPSHYLKADSTSFSYNLRISSSFKGLVGYSSGYSTDTAAQYSGNIQNIFYYHVKNAAVGLGTGIENSMFYINDKHAFFRAYEAPVFMSFKLTDNDEKMHVFQNFGLAVPVKCDLQNTGAGYYFQTGIGFGSRKLRGELSYKIITLGRDNGPLRNYNLTFGLCFIVK